MRRTKRISLRVPPGVDSGSRLRVRGEGNAGRRGGPEGDLYVFISVRADPELVSHPSKSFGNHVDSMRTIWENRNFNTTIWEIYYNISNMGTISQMVS